MVKRFYSDEAGKRRVIGRFYLIQFGIPAVLLAFEVFLALVIEEGLTPRISRPLSALVGAVLLVVGLGLWTFFSSVLFRRLWSLFPVAGEESKFWVYAEGVFGLVGVGVSMTALLGFFHFLLARDVVVGITLGIVSLALGALEARRFEARVKEAADAVKAAGEGKGSSEQGDEG